MDGASTKFGEVFSAADLESIRAGLAEYSQGFLMLDHNHPDVTKEMLEIIWEAPEEEVWIEFCYQESDWSVSFTHQFRKDIARIDAKLRGRVLSAISEISETPNVAKGDTIKPLSSDLKGLWRYRLGDSRLIYMPDDKLREITLISFSSRGEAYNS